MTDKYAEGWISFDDRWPNQSPALDDPSVTTTDRVLVTNNINSRDRMGRMSHVWFEAPIRSSDGSVIAYQGFREICALTHWRDPFSTGGSDGR